MTKVPLLRERESWSPPTHKTLHLTQAYPFFRSAFGHYIHRIKSGQIHIRDGEYSHTHFHLWCGQIGYHSEGKRRGELFSKAPERGVFCATCEGRAIGAGMDGARVINGRPVLFNSRI